MKFLLAATLMLALGVGQSAAQTGTTSPGVIGATSPLGADFGQTPGNAPSAAQIRRVGPRRQRGSNVTARGEFRPDPR